VLEVYNTGGSSLFIYLFIYCWGRCDDIWYQLLATPDSTQTVSEPFAYFFFVFVFYLRASSSPSFIIIVIVTCFFFPLNEK
jgi:hypothetical protein